MQNLLRISFAGLLVGIWSFTPLRAEPLSINTQMKYLAHELGISGNQKDLTKRHRITLGQFLDKLKPMMNEEQYKKFSVYISTVRNKELPEVVIEANKMYLKEGTQSVRLQAERDKNALVSVEGTLITNAEFDDVHAAIKKIEATLKKQQLEEKSVGAYFWSLLVPESQAWLMALAIFGAAAVFGYFLYKGFDKLSHMNVNGTLNVAGGTTNTLTTTSNINLGLNSSINPFSSLNIYNTSPTSSGASK